MAVQINYKQQCQPGATDWELLRKVKGAHSFLALPSLMVIHRSGCSWQIPTQDNNTKYTIDNARHGSHYFLESLMAKKINIVYQKCKQNLKMCNPKKL